jgi:threonine dehydrogenase-like Zn-dependent dehydrogenase
MAKARGARLVIGLDTVADRLKMAHGFGADETIDVSTMSEPDLIKAVRDLCRPDGADVVLEVCGVPAVIPAGLAMVRTGGRYTLAGLVNPQSEVTVDANVILKRWITLRGIHNYHPRHLIQALDFVVSHRERYPFAQIVDATFTLDQLDEAFRRASDQSILRAAIVP